EARPRANVQAPLQDRSVDVALEGMPADIDRPHVTEGRLPENRSEVLVERSFARESDLRPGAALTLDGTDYTIAGLAVTTQQATYPRWDPGLVWAPDIAADSRRVAVRLADPEATEAYVAAARRALPGRRLAVIDWHDVRDTITDQTRTYSLIISINTLLALCAVGFTVATVISGRVLAQRREIGLLKSVGVTPRGVVALLVGEYLAIALAAGVLGVIAGSLIAPALLKPMANVLATPTPSAWAPPPLLLALALILLAVAVFTAIPALRAGRVNTVAALALGRAGGAMKASRTAQLAAALRLPAVARLGVKDAFTSRVRTVLTVSALALMVMTLVSALSAEATFDRVIADPALRAKPYDLTVEPGALGEAATLDLVRSDPAVERATTITGLQVTAPGVGTTQARVIGDTGFAYAVPDGRMFERPGEAIAGRGLLDALGAEVGDRLTVRVGEQPVTVTLVGRHVEPDNDGKVLIFHRDTLPASTRLNEAEIIASFKPGTDEAAAAQRLETAAQHRVATELTDDEVREERADMIPILFGTCALLVAVAFVNLLATLLLVTRERARDFAIFKAIGLTPRGVLGVVNTGGAVLGLLAIAIGIPLGLVTFRSVMVMLSPSEGADIVGVPGPFALALIVPIVLAVTALASSIPARRAARTGAAAVLRAE
ncbi:MAG TPA: FtsX-like permease family protein, partial [Solirubrobacter sp.]|nr:FtsX-like permease family protein [Solirubrobacter sp.]